jgi:very-short-patch-repair endonuclease
MVADPQVKQAQTATHFEQRFNVALSRARDRIVLVRSVTEEELNPADLKARVIRHFREPMPETADPGPLEALCESDLERAVLRRLVERRFRVTPQVGAQGYRIDLVVEGADGRRLAVECDGDRFQGPERWADDMRRQRVLERVGWRFWRVWASSFTLDPDGCMADLFATLERMGIEPAGPDTAPRRYTEHRTARSAPSEAAPARREPSPAPARGIRIGDRVALRSLDDNKALTVTVSDGRDDPVNGFVAAASPLGAALLGLSEEDEAEWEEDGRLRRVLVVKTERGVLAEA